MDNVFQDSTFRILLNASFRIVTVMPNEKIMLHYIYENLRDEEGITVIECFPITEFLSLYRGQTDSANLLALLTNFMERNKLVVLRIHKIPYISHAAI